MNIIIVSSHFFVEGYRKAGVHHFADAFKKNGNNVSFITVSQGLLKSVLRPDVRRFRALQVANGGRGGVKAFVSNELLHPASGGFKLVQLLTRPLFRLYGRRVPQAAKESVRAADLIIFECGYALCYYRAMKRLNGHAYMVAFSSDKLDVVGYRQEIIELEQRLAPEFDMVRVNAPHNMSDFPPEAHVVYIPQGVDRDSMDAPMKSPYEHGTDNIICIGNMLFDEHSAILIADACGARGGRLHLIGAGATLDHPAVVVHGEMSFEAALPFVKFAAAGLAPYRDTGAAYLASSSLKIAQYRYFGIPVIHPRYIQLDYRNSVDYIPYDRASIGAAVAEAFSRSLVNEGDTGALDWTEVAARIICRLVDRSRSKDYFDD